MTLDKHVVVRQRRRQQVLAYNRRRLNPYLRTAQVLLILAACNGYVHRQQTLHIVTQLNQRILARHELAEEVFNHLVNNYNIPCEDLMDLVERLYKIEHSIDQETQLFGFLLKVKSLDLKNHV